MAGLERVLFVVGLCFVCLNTNKAYAWKKGRYVSFPIISLNGKWLQQSGFKGGQVVDITCEECRLIITLAKKQRFKIV